MTMRVRCAALTSCPPGETTVAADSLATLTWIEEQTKLTFDEWHNIIASYNQRCGNMVTATPLLTLHKIKQSVEDYSREIDNLGEPGVTVAVLGSVITQVDGAAWHASRPRGIVRCGQTCHLLAVVQLLAALPSPALLATWACTEWPPLQRLLQHQLLSHTALHHDRPAAFREMFDNDFLQAISNGQARAWMAEQQDACETLESILRLAGEQARHLWSLPTCEAHMCCK